MDTETVKKDETNQNTSTKPMDLDDNSDTDNDNKKDATKKDTKGSVDGDKDTPLPWGKSGIKDADGGTPSSDPMTNRKDVAYAGTNTVEPVKHELGEMKEKRP